MVGRVGRSLATYRFDGCGGELVAGNNVTILSTTVPRFLQKFTVIVSQLLLGSLRFCPAGSGSYDIRRKTLGRFIVGLAWRNKLSIHLRISLRSFDKLSMGGQLFRFDIP